MSSRWAALPGPLPRPAGRKRHLHPPGNHASYSWLTSPPALHLQHLVTYWVLIGQTPAGGRARVHRRSCALWPQEGLSQRTAHSAAGMVPESPLCWGDRLPLSKAGRHLTLHPTRPAPGFQCDPAAPAPSLFAKTGVSPRPKLNTHGPWWRTALSPLPEVFLLERGPPGPPRESRVPPLSCGRWSSFLSISSQ